MFREDLQFICVCNNEHKSHLVQYSLQTTWALLHLRQHAFRFVFRSFSENLYVSAPKFGQFQRVKFQVVCNMVYLKYSLVSKSSIPLCGMSLWSSDLLQILK